MSTTPVVLASTPWMTLRTPSIQIGTIKAVLDRAGIPAKTAHIYVSFYHYLKKQLGQEIPGREQQTPQALFAYHQAEIEKWWPIIKAANIKGE